MPQKVTRLPTNMCPNSPDSTPAMSRQVTDDVPSGPDHQGAPHIASVLVREHEGQKSKERYKFIPSQMVSMEH